MSEQQLVWVGVIFDPYGDWVYVGATKEALFHDMRNNYAEIENRDESDWDWEKRLVNSGARLDVDSYYVETEEGDGAA